MRPNRREDILDAVERVILNQGIARFTIDAVAEESAIAKGGVLYHFPSKQALLEGLLARALARYGEDIAEAQAKAGAHGNVAQAHIGVMTRTGSRMSRMVPILLAISISEPGLLRAIQPQVAAYYEGLLAHGGGPEAVVAMLAVNGLFLTEQLGIKPFTGKHRDHVIAAINRLAGKP